MSFNNVNLFNLLENTQIGVVIHNASGAVEYANPAAASMLSLSLEELKDKSMDVEAWEFIDRQNRRLSYDELPVVRVLSTGKPVDNQILGIIDKTIEKTAWFNVNAYPEKHSGNGITPPFVVVYFTNITTKINDFSYKDIVQNSQDMILVTEAKNINAPLSPKIIYANEALCKHTEYSLEELIGETPRIFQGTLTDKASTDRIRQALIEQHPCTETLLNYTKTGTPFWVQMNIFPLTNDFGEVTHFAAVQRNVSEMKFQSEQLDKRNSELKRIKHDLESLVHERTSELRDANLKLEKLAYFDALTNIPNRRAFMDAFSKSLMFAKRNSYEVLVGIADVDHFKSINDNLGHGFGDEVLTIVAQTMQSFFRSEDAIGRIGGEEFAFCIVLLSQVSPHQILDRLRQKVSKLHETQPLLKSHKITVSIGAVQTNELQHKSPKQLLTYADKALYKAKNSGRNTVECIQEGENISPISAPKPLDDKSRKVL
ncbi:response regulator [Alteromonas marina]|jgi:diguanylate cyclase (GGDEF)-like protein/PAS domain S-box-containing protein|uniref:Response regulator n=1 Tax=Alteromonas marina TaxID=203795 RepID=A0A0B3XXU2_9ALTE|nr:sensor domain-containing diguanylate cyclase [Alteromonas marina]KHT54421.1 response regulator [Alteromonas marina]